MHKSLASMTVGHSSEKIAALTQALAHHQRFHKQSFWPIIETYLAIGPLALLKVIDTLMLAELELNQRTMREIARSDAEVHDAQTFRLSINSDRGENLDPQALCIGAQP